jgi:hypothetical protein
MPRRRNLNLAGELGDDVDVTEDEALAAETLIPVAPVVTPPPAAPASFTMTAADLQNMVTAAVSAAQSGNAELAQAVTKGIADAREPIPENKIGPAISDANPLGERDHPRPGLKCDIAFGVQDRQTKVVQDTITIEAADLTAQEQIALNTLTPMQAVIKRLDGVPFKVSIVPTTDPVTDQVSKLTIVVPTEITGKGSLVKNMLPGPLSIVQQLTGRDFSTLAGEELAWFMAEHRAKRYVSVRELTAA